MKRSSFDGEYAPDGLAAAHHVQRRVDFLQRKAVGDQFTELELAGLVEVEIARNVGRWIRLPAFTAGQDLSEVQRQGVDRDVLVVPGHSDENGAALGRGQFVGGLD